MEELLAYSERVVRTAIRELPDGRFEGVDALETPEGLLEIRATVTIVGDAIDIDFAGTAPQHAGNLNCPLAVTRSACFYVVRCLTAPDLAASGGAFEPVTVRAPEGCVANARSPAAVAAGNTETSSRITDVVFAALGQALPVPAQGQGTMNNVVFGNDRFTYYETIGGGQGRMRRGATARPRSTWPCRTRSTPRSRRSSSPIRCASSATSFGWARAAPAGIAVATESSGSSVRSRRVACRSSPSVVVSRRAAPRAARTEPPGERC